MWCAMEKNEQVAKAVSSLTDVLGKAAGLFVLLTAITIYIGYRIEFAYFHTVGVPWMMHQLEPAQVVLKASGLILASTLGLAISLCNLLGDGSLMRMRLPRSNILFVLIVFLLFPVYFLAAWVEVESMEIFVGVVAALVLFSVGYLLGELVRLHVYQRNQWTEGHIFILLCIGILLWFGSWAKGWMSAKLDLETPSTLHKVSGLQGDWSLLRTVGDKYLLVQQGPDGKFEKFTLAPIDSDIVVLRRVFIQAPSQSTPSAPGSD